MKLIKMEICNGMLQTLKYILEIIDGPISFKELLVHRYFQGKLFPFSQESSADFILCCLSEGVEDNDVVSRVILHELKFSLQSNIVCKVTLKII